MVQVFIGLGSNLDEPLLQLKDAIVSLNKIKETTFISSSNFYRSAPMGPQDQPDYVNVVVKLTTTLNPERLPFSN